MMHQQAGSLVFTSLTSTLTSYLHAASDEVEFSTLNQNCQAQCSALVLSAPSLKDRLDDHLSSCRRNEFFSWKFYFRSLPTNQYIKTCMLSANVEIK